MLFRKQRGDDLEILIRLLDPDRFDRFRAVRFEALVQSLDKCLAQLVARALGTAATDISR